MTRIINRKITKPKTFQAFYGLSSKDYNGCSFDEIKRYDQLGRELKANAFFNSVYLSGSYDM
jgi:hypothetical protein